MTRRQLTWLLAVMLAVPVLLLMTFGFVAGTESGTRWLLRTAEPYLPEPLSIGDAEGSLLGGVIVGQLSWTDDAVDVRVQNLGIDLELLPLINRQIRILTLTADSVSVDVEPRADEAPDGDGLPDIDLPVSIYVDQADLANIRIGPLGEGRGIERIRLSGSFDDSLLSLQQLVVESAWADLDIEGTLRLAGRYVARLTAAWSYRQNDELEFAGRLVLDGDLRRYDLSHDLERPLILATRGNLVASADEPVIDIVNTWNSIEWTVAGRNLTATDGSLLLRGTRRSLMLDLATLARIDDFPEAQLSLEGNTDLESLRIDALTVSGEPGTVSATGNASWTGAPAFDLELEVEELDAALLSDRLAGRIGITARASGTVPEAGPKIDIDVAALRGELNGHPLSGSAGLQLDGAAVAISDGNISLGSNNIIVAGRINDELDLTGSLDFNALRQLDARLRGKLTGRFELNGARANPVLAMSIEAEGPGWNEIQAESLTFEGSLSPAQTIESTLDVRGLVVGSLLLDDSKLSLDGSLDSHRYRVGLANADGRLALEGTGNLADSRWSGRVETLDVSSSVLEDWSLEEPVRIDASASNTSVSNFCLASLTTEGRFCALFDYASVDGGKAQLEVRRFPLAALPFSLPAGATLAGYIEAGMDASFDSAGVRGSADARLVEAAVEATYEDEPYRLSVSSAELELDVENNRLVSKLDVNLDDGAGLLDISLNIGDVRNNESPLEGRGSLTIPDASIFSVFVPDLANAEGRIDGNLAAGGSLTAPDVTGEVLLEDAAFDVRPAGIRISDLNLALRQRSAGQLQITGSARSGDGSLSIEGETSISAETGLRTEMRLEGENFRLIELPDWQVSTSPEIRLVLDDRAAVVTGSLDVPSASISVKSLPDTATRPSGDVIVHDDRQAEARAGRRIDVNVMASLGEDVRLSAFGLTTNVTGAVRIRGGSDRPYTGTGSLNLVNGRYKAYGQNLEIESGELIFNGPLETPQLDVQAVRRLEEYDVTTGIRLTGTPRRLNSTVYSEPTLSDAEALSYLLTGRPLSAPGDAENADILNQAAFALGLSQAGSIASQIRGDLGLDTLKVEGGADTGRIIAGKRIGDRLLVEYGYGLIDKLGSLMLRYQLTNRLVLETRAGVSSEIDVVYSVRKK